MAGHDAAGGATTITDAASLRDYYGTPTPRALKKQLSFIDKHFRHFISLSPFLVMATSDAAGRLDASPKGDAPGFVHVADDKTLLIPDRVGNNRCDGLHNLLENPRIGLLFFLPGRDETLRVNGRAEIVTAPAVLEALAAQGKPPRAAIRVTVEEAYMHCGKSVIRSDLWNSDKHIGKTDFPSLGRVLADQIEGLDPETSERMTEESYRTRLY
ncbi:MAG TPA: pyridoxamine 5'-phosphate oxidase family protein [Terriglobales bacterium]|nr:pyridoxamine 5'-phosphate oxidase family protein [Terriglobales bacterium]